MNAGVQQVPRFGIFGSRNFLVLGLPLLQAVTPTELRAVVAHELAHLSRSHGRVNVWLYRIRATWGQLLESLEER
jgi:Zn-dependent protease with chaperone function